jgi:hypothetical protein
MSVSGMSQMRLWKYDICVNPPMLVSLLNLLTLKPNVVETANVKAPERVRCRECVLTYQAFCEGGAAGFYPGVGSLPGKFQDPVLKNLVGRITA